MYFDLTKEKYKEYSKKFRKTYIGKKVYCNYIVSLVWFIIMIFGIVSIDIFSVNITKEIQSVIVECFFAISSVIAVFYYEKLYYLELKDYIKSQKK